MSDRGVSTMLAYVLTLGIATMLVTGLVVAGGDFVSDNRKVVVDNELEVIGQQLLAQFEQADRLARGSSVNGPASLSLDQSLPDAVAGSTYNIVVDTSGSTPQLVLKTQTPDATMAFDLAISSDVVDSSADGGPVTVQCVEGSSGDCEQPITLEVTDD